MSHRARLTPPPHTGWPPGLLQDDSRGLSRWFANKPDARRRVREACADIARARQEQEGDRYGLKKIPPAPR